MKKPRDSGRLNAKPASHKILILDTNILLCWLDVTGFNTGGSLSHKTVTAELDKERINGTMLLIPYAMIIEVGTILTNLGNDGIFVEAFANKFIKILEQAKEYTKNNTSPPSNKEHWWRLASASQISYLFSPDTIFAMVKEWLQKGKDKAFVSIPSVADLSIKSMCDYYKERKFLDVEVYSTDAALNRYLEQYQIQIKRS